MSHTRGLKYDRIMVVSSSPEPDWVTDFCESASQKHHEWPRIVIASLTHGLEEIAEPEDRTKF